MARKTAILALALCLALCASPASAWFFGKSKKAAEKPAVKEAEPVKEEAVQPPAMDEPSPRVFWYNERTGETQWEAPSYERVNEEGKTFYIDPVTKESSWERPASLQWRELANEEGKVFYYNDATQVSQWEKPEALAWTQMQAQAGAETRSEL